MQCPSCSSTVEVGAKFCGQCGQALPRPCPSCSHSNTAGTKFCSECGASLGAGDPKKSPLVPPATASASPRRSASPPAQAERRHLTVMFCDMVGSSALSTQLDPEVHRDVVAGFQSACAAEIKRFDGMVAQYLGDGVLAYFGFPTAHEDDAERAVRAGLAILSAVSTLRLADGVVVQSRIGIASGVVVIGDLVREGVTQENAAIGETTNLAARLQGIAEPDTVVVAPATHHLVGALFEYRDLGAHAVKGFAAPVTVRQVLRASTVENRYEARHQDGTTPLLGRDEELELLLRRWHQAKHDGGRVVLITGEAGIGKSRLTRALQEQLAAEPHSRLIYHCSPYHQDSSLYPIIGQLARAAGFEREDTPAARIDKLRSLLVRTSETLDADLPLFAALLSIPTGEPPPELSPQQLKERTFAALVAQLQRLSESQPVLILYEDLHWIDPTSLELLTRIVNRTADHRLLVLATARPEFEMPWPNHRHVGTVALSRLNRVEGRALVQGMTRGKALPDEVLDQIIARTDGVPLFVEELTKTVLESGLLREAGERYELSGPLPPFAIPSTLHASLLARLDRQASVKDVAQVGAVIGREFSYRLLSAVAAMPETELRSALGQLVDAGLVFQRGEPPEASYQFKHALVQDAAYESLVRSRKQQIHGKIAQVLEQRLAVDEASEPETLAYHFSAAGLTSMAADYWQRAGERALQQSALFEASNHLTNALKAIQAMDESPARAKRELELQLSLASALHPTKGQSSVELANAYERARRLCEEVNDPRQLFRVLMGLSRLYGARAQFELGNRVVEQLFELAQGMRDPELLLQGHLAYGSMELFSGNLIASDHHLNAAIALYDADAHREHAIRFTIDPGVTAMSRASLSLWYRGYPEQARQMSIKTLTLARRNDHAHSLGMALILSGMLHQFLRDSQALHALARQALNLSMEHRLNDYLLKAKFLLAWVNAQGRQAEEGHQGMRDSLNEYKNVGGTLDLQWYQGLLAQAYLARGEINEGLNELDQAEKLTGSSGLTSIYLPELYRIKGELLLSQNLQSEAEQSLLSSLTTARQQNAKSFELRAATDLARLWHDQGKRAEARDLLAPVYGWFTEGFDTADLKDAKALLDELT